MNTKASAGPETVSGRLDFFDPVRNIAMLSVVLYHASAAYSSLTPWWATHDGVSIFADCIRILFDVFMMPVFFFIAGFFAPDSLEKRGTVSFISEKLKRLGIPWLLVMLTIIPLTLFAVMEKESGTGFAGFFFGTYLSRFGNVRLDLMPAGQINQMHFWYISLLLLFFIVYGSFAPLRAAFRRKPSGTAAAGSRLTAASGKEIVLTILLFTLACVAVSFPVSLFIPDMSWLSVDLLFQFQPTKAGTYFLSFLLGTVAQRRRWFADKTFFTGPGLPAGASLILAIVYLVLGRNVALHVGDSQTLSPAMLFLYSVCRSLLFPSILLTLLSLSIKYASGRVGTVNRKLAETSFSIYLVHFFFIVFLQEFFMLWSGGPAAAKMIAVFLITLPMSYGLGRAIDRFPRATAGVFLLLFAAGLAFMR